MKSFLLKFLFTSLIIYLGQLLISNVFPPKIPETAVNFNLAYHEKKPEIMYLVDSTDYVTDSEEKDHDAISLIMEKELKCATVGAIVQNGGNPDIFAAYAKFIARFQPPPDYLIVEINMRAFGAAWDKDPQFEFNEQKLFFDWFAETALMPFWPFFSNSGFINFQPANSTTTDQPPSIFLTLLRKAGLMRYPESPPNEPYPDNPLKNLIHANYMNNLTKNHRKIQSLLRIADMFASKKTKLIFYFTPIDYQPKQSFMGDKFVTQLKKNVNLVKTALLEKQVTVLDLSTSLSAEAFTWRSIMKANSKLENLYNNEHLMAQGRHFVAKALTDEIGKTFIKVCPTPTPAASQGNAPE
ncbi:MAG: hypothetical protein AAB557_00315 [Patescibacteria group bacterium]